MYKRIVFVVTIALLLTLSAGAVTAQDEQPAEQLGGSIRGTVY
jgi:hypothetical protein